MGRALAIAFHQPPEVVILSEAAIPSTPEVVILNEVAVPSTPEVVILSEVKDPCICFAFVSAPLSPHIPFPANLASAPLSSPIRPRNLASAPASR